MSYVKCVNDNCFSRVNLPKRNILLIFWTEKKKNAEFAITEDLLICTRVTKEILKVSGPVLRMFITNATH